MFLNGMPILAQPKPVIDIQMDFAVPDGYADCYDANGQYMGRFSMSLGKCPPAARTARVPPDTFFQMRRSASINSGETDGPAANLTDRKQRGAGA